MAACKLWHKTSSMLFSQHVLLPARPVLETLNGFALRESLAKEACACKLVQNMRMSNSGLLPRRLIERASHEAWWARAWVWLSVCFQRHVMMRARVPADLSAHKRSALQRSRSAAALASAANAAGERGNDITAGAPAPTAFKLPEGGDPSVNGGSLKANGRSVADIVADAKALAAVSDRSQRGGTRAAAELQQREQPAALNGGQDSARDVEMGMMGQRDHSDERESEVSATDSVRSLPQVPSMEAPLLRQQVRASLDLTLSSVSKMRTARAWRC